MKHIYIHIPFCRRRCIYCDFSIAVRREIPAERYVAAIESEYEHRKDAGDWDDAPVETIYFGGGTPSLLPAERLGELLKFFLNNERVSDGQLESTLEANPEDVSTSSAQAWHDAGFNRVSLGVQSFDERVLEWTHRTHSADSSTAAVQTLRDAGFDSVSLDLISALPPHLHHEFPNDLQEALQLEPDHISVYGLTVEPRTALARWIDTERVIPASDEVFAKDFVYAHGVLSEAGYEHYEVSNYALAGKRARHNLAYWDGSPFAGLGPSAHGFDGVERRWNVDPWALYESLVTASGWAIGGRETLDPEQARLESVYLGLRVSSGLSMRQRAGLNPALVASAEENGWAETVGGRWRLTPSGWLRLDEIVTGLTTSPEGG